MGQLLPQPTPGQVGVSYALTSLTLWVNGSKEVDLSPVQPGAAVNPFGQIADSLTPTGPCVGSVCAPLGGYIETTGAAPLVVLQLPTGTILGPTVPKECLYQNPNGACPLQERRGERT